MRKVRKVLRVPREPKVLPVRPAPPAHKVHKVRQVQPVRRVRKAHKAQRARRVHPSAFKERGQRAEHTTPAMSSFITDPPTFRWSVPTRTIRRTPRRRNGRFSRSKVRPAQREQPARRERKARKEQRVRKVLLDRPVPQARKERRVPPARLARRVRKVRKEQPARKVPQSRTEERGRAAALTARAASFSTMARHTSRSSIRTRTISRVPRRHSGRSWRNKVRLAQPARPELKVRKAYKA